MSELGGPLDAARYRAVWGAWEGREKEFYRASAELVAPLDWDAVLGICGPAVRVLLGLVRDAYDHLVSDAIPERLRLGSVALTHAAGGKFRVVSYSPYDPVMVPEELVSALGTFDGRPTEDALTAILAERNLRVELSLVRRLVDFGLLKAEEEPGPALLPVR